MIWPALFEGPLPFALQPFDRRLHGRHRCRARHPDLSGRAPKSSPAPISIRPC